MKFSYLHFSKKQRGFTLVEMLVSVAIFTFVMLIATASIFTIVAANKKAESLKSVMDNLDFALESMTRNIRTGSSYNCGSQAGGDCTSGASSFYFTSSQSPNCPGSCPIVGYSLSGGQIIQSESDWTAPLPITAAEIHISTLNFILVGSAARDGLQPRVIMTVIGSAGTSSTATQFKIQTTLSQRQIDS
jgi:prepilin-type N-terminal cleavage/methylation domain-containing protein